MIQRKTKNFLFKCTIFAKIAAAKLAQQYDGLSLEKLWTYGSLLTKDRNVSCIAWNSKNNVSRNLFFEFFFM